MDKMIEDAKQDDGSLYRTNCYINWVVGDEEVCLDGDFTIQQLRDIANHMEQTHK